MSFFRYWCQECTYAFTLELCIADNWRNGGICEANRNVPKETYLMSCEGTCISKWALVRNYSPNMNVLISKNCHLNTYFMERFLPYLLNLPLTRDSRTKSRNENAKKNYTACSKIGASPIVINQFLIRIYLWKDIDMFYNLSFHKITLKSTNFPV